MGLELIRDMLRFEQVVGEGQGQALVNKDIIVPDIKPDIARILSVEGKVNITSKEVEQDRIAVEGDVDFQILYAATGEPQPIYSMSQSANFSHFMDVPGAVPRMESEVRCDIEHIDFNRLNGRKLNMQCVLNLKGKVTDSVPVDVVKEIGGAPDIQVLRDTITTDEVIGENTAQVVVRGTIPIPEGISGANQLLKYSAIIHNKDTRIEEGKVIMTGSAFVPVLFLSKDEDADIYRVSDDIVFTHTMEIPGAGSGMTCYGDYKVEDVYAELKEDEEGKGQIDVEVVVGLKSKVTEKSDFPIIIDAYAPSVRTEYEKKSLTMDIFFARDTSQAIIKESISIPEGLLGMDRVYDMVCKPMVTDCKITDDRVNIEGVVGCDVIYLEQGEERAVNSFSEEVPFRTTITIPDCNADMKPSVDVDIESMEFTMVTKEEVEVRIALNCDVKVYNKVKKEFIIKMEEVEGEVPLHKASITIYVVQPRDTMWNIAKRYLTTVQDIVRINEIADPDKLTPGMKLIIPKKLYRSNS